MLLIEALHRLLENKLEALGLRAEGVQPGGPGGRPFEERDFGVPQIDRLLAKLDAD